MIVYVLEFGNQRIEFSTLEGPEGANQYKADNNIDSIPFEFEKVIATDELTLAQKQEKYEQKIIQLFTYLMNRALSSSMGKYGTYEYLQIQRDEYFLKYKVAKGIEENQPIANAIQKEMERDFPTPMLDAILTSYGYTDLSGTQLEKMYALIIIRYEYAKQRLDTFEGMAIDFRTKSRTLVELFQWQKLDTAFALIENLPNELSDTDIENYYNQFDAL